MSSRFPHVTALVTAAVYAGFAVWLGATPRALLTAFGMEASTPAMLTEIRAFYGGLELGLAVAIVWLTRRGEVSAALLIGGLPLAGSATGRLIGLALDGPSTTHLAMAMIEGFGAALCLAARRQV